jgi:cytochrome c oxidase assembly protein subunit 15
MGMVFIAGFVYFLWKKKFNQPMIKPMVVLFVLGALQGAIGWIMVQSGLVPEKYFVGHIELATHFMAAMGLLAYTYWFALQLMVPDSAKIRDRSLRSFLLLLLFLLLLQLTYGAFMAGLKAGQSAPSWPSINGYLIPPTIDELHPFYKNLLNNNLTIQFIHRGLAYLILILSVVGWIKASGIKNNVLFARFKKAYLVIITVQVVLGIITVLNANNPQYLFGWVQRISLLACCHYWQYYLFYTLFASSLLLDKQLTHKF